VLFRSPGAASDRDVIFLERVAKGDEKVPSAEVLKGIKKRVESKIARLESSFKQDVKSLESASKGSPDLEFAFKFLSGAEQTPTSAPVTLKPFPK
jgi:hypothetical protein